MKSETKYALRNKTTGELVRFTSKSNVGGYACVSETITLCYGGGLDDAAKVYEQTTLRALAKATARDTEAYNADYSTPSHGEVRVEDLEFVKRTVSEALERVAFRPAPTLVSRFRADKPVTVLRRYAGVQDLELNLRTMMLFEMPEGETLESIRERSRQEVFPTSSLVGTDVELVAVFPVPEDYVPDLRGKPGFGAVVRDVKPGFELPPAVQPALFAVTEGAPVPVPAIWPLDESNWRPFVDTFDMVTFAALVPLATLLRGHDAVCDYLQEAVDKQVLVDVDKLTAISASCEDDEGVSGGGIHTTGDVLLHVTCKLFGPRSR